VSDLQFHGNFDDRVTNVTENKWLDMLEHLHVRYFALCAPACHAKNSTFLPHVRGWSTPGRPGFAAVQNDAVTHCFSFKPLD